MLGLTFKENCPDLRNTKVVDVMSELQAFGAEVEVYDPWVDAAQAHEECGITRSQPPRGCDLRRHRARGRPPRVPGARRRAHHAAGQRPSTCCSTSSSCPRERGRRADLSVQVAASGTRWLMAQTKHVGNRPRERGDLLYRKPGSQGTHLRRPGTSAMSVTSTAIMSIDTRPTSGARIAADEHQRAAEGELQAAPSP